MEDLTAFKNKIVLHMVKVTLIFEAVAAIVIAIISFAGYGNLVRLEILFAYGLALGTCISILNFNVLAFTLNRIFLTGKSALAGLSYFLRLIIYGGAFFFAMNTSYLVGLGCALGFATSKIAIYHLHGLKPKFSEERTLSPETKAYYEDEDRKKEEGDDNARI